MTEQTRERKLVALRAELKRRGVDGFIVPRGDEYLGEYVPPSAERLRWLTGFSGSAGVAIVFPERAVVMSDGRYTIQLKQQVDLSLYEVADSTMISPSAWLADHGKGLLVGYDPRLHTPREIKGWREKGVQIQALAENPVDAIWTDRPTPPSALVELFPVSIAGLTAAEKLDKVAAELERHKTQAALITLPDSLAWLLNIRSHDIPHIPVALSCGILREDGTLDWFIDPDRVPAGVLESFGNRVTAHTPARLRERLQTLRGKKVLLDGRRSTQAFADLIQDTGGEVIDAKDPCITLKAIKTPSEQAAMRSAHMRDGVAFVRFLKWFEKEAPKERLTEIDVEQKLEEFRRVAPEYRDSSFDTIAGYGPNGAIIHYRATPETSRIIEKWNLLLLDSGAQYADGTTDITRTLAVGKPTEVMRRHYTLVLKAHIAVASARFPIGTTGAQIDALARAPLWQENMDYAHGTGHGVGCYLSVHEESASLSPRGTEPVEPGMILSNEPGYYREGAYGIRLENLVLCYEDGVCDGTGKPMLAFETLTLAPFDKTLIDLSLLTPDEKFWLASYHKKVLATLSPHLQREDAGWLKKAIVL